MDVVVRYAVLTGIGGVCWNMSNNSGGLSAVQNPRKVPEKGRRGPRARQVWCVYLVVKLFIIFF